LITPTANKSAYRCNLLRSLKAGIKALAGCMQSKWRGEAHQPRQCIIKENMKLICWLNGIYLTLQHLDMACYGFIDGCELEEQKNGDIKCTRCGRVSK
jgi:hypothetical protein